MKTSKMPYLLTLLIYCWPDTSSAGKIATGSVLTNPSVGQRCYELKQDKKKVQEIQHRLSALLERNRRLLLKSTPEQKNLRKKIAITQGGLEREFLLIQVRIENINENLIRKGCPGIHL